LHTLSKSSKNGEIQQLLNIISSSDFKFIDSVDVSVSNENSNNKDVPWSDIKKIPFTIIGRYLSDLFHSTFVDNLHNPSQRPTAADWIQAIIKTRDLLHPCPNKNNGCPMGWFVFDDSMHNQGICPYCGATIDDKPIPQFKFYQNQNNSWVDIDRRFVIYDERYLYPWHVYPSIVQNEFLKPEQTKAVGYFKYLNNKWFFINQSLKHLSFYNDQQQPQPTPINQKLALKNNLFLYLDPSTDSYGVRCTLSS
jgi:hypothetical protein